MFQILAYAGAAYIISICIYRLRFHAFAHVPGPFLAKLTNAYSAYHAARQNTHVEIQRLHDNYGKVVSILLLHKLTWQALLYDMDRIGSYSTAKSQWRVGL